MVRPDDEERRLDVMLFQNVQNLFRVSGFIARVERQIDHLFLGIPDVDRVILAQRARRQALPTGGCPSVRKLRPHDPVGTAVAANITGSTAQNASTAPNASRIRAFSRQNRLIFSITKHPHHSLCAACLS